MSRPRAARQHPRTRVRVPRRHETALRRSESLYRATARSIPGGGLSLVDFDLRYLIVEGELLRWVGLSQRVMEGRRVEEVFPGETGRVRAEHFRRALAGEITSYETDYHGHTVWSQFGPVRARNGRILAAMSLALDITERKRSEEALRASREALARVNEELDLKVRERTAKLEETVAELQGLSYSLVHDLRSPLRAMLGYATILEAQAGQRLTGEETALLRKIGLAANRMDQLVTDSLNYSRLLLEDLPVSPVNLRALIVGLVETYPNLHPPQADISIELDDLFVYGNEAALTQVFSNLLGNAVKFVAPGVHPRVRVWAEPSDPATAPAQPSTVICVQDNGIGIPPEAKDKIFCMFQRLHRADEYPGTGIGLAIVRKSLERIGGRVHLISEVGQGSRFCVTLLLFDGDPSSACPTRHSYFIPPPEI